MSYTPKFQQFLKELNILTDKNLPIEEIREFFKKSMIEIGPYERINNLYKVRPKRPVPGERTRYVSFRMNKMQEEFWHNKTNRDTILKMRQGGTTTLSCIIALDMCIFGGGVNAAIMAHVLPNVKKYFRITKNAFTQFQKDWGWFYPVTNTVDNVTELHIDETSSILMVCTETKGLTLDFLHISEAAWVDDDRIQESIESVPLSGSIIMESTPNGAAGMFYTGWNNFLQDPDSSMFTGHFYPWWYIYPEEQDIKHLKRPKNLSLTGTEQELLTKYSLNTDHIIWRRLKISECNNSEAEFLKKHPEDPITCFLSGDTAEFDIDTLRGLLINSKPPAFLGDISIRS